MPNIAIASRLSNAELVHRQALQKHELERTEFSRRVLAEAAAQLEAAEREAELALVREKLTCGDCGWVAVGERWSLAGAESPEEPGISIVAAPGAPSWAAEYAVQGMERVTRYACPECGKVVALIGG